MHCMNMVVKFGITPMSTDISINSANIITHSLQTVDWQALTHLRRTVLAHISGAVSHTQTDRYHWVSSYKNAL